MGEVSTLYKTTNFQPLYKTALSSPNMGRQRPPLSQEGSGRTKHGKATPIPLSREGFVPLPSTGGITVAPCTGRLFPHTGVVRTGKHVLPSHDADIAIPRVRRLVWVVSRAQDWGELRHGTRATASQIHTLAVPHPGTKRARTALTLTLCAQCCQLGRDIRALPQRLRGGREGGFPLGR